MDAFWNQLTDLGDFFVTGVLALWAIGFASLGQSRGLALRWLIGLITSMSLVVLTKVAFEGWGIEVAAIDFTGISGHMVQSAAVYPTLLWLLIDQPGRRRTILAFAAASVVIAAIGLSRWVLAAHSTSEIVAGTLVGMCVSGAAIGSAPEGIRWSVTQRRMIAAGTLGVLAVSTLGLRAPTPAWVDSIAKLLSGHTELTHRADLAQSHCQRLPQMLRPGFCSAFERG